jgi:hypothetical protein
VFAQQFQPMCLVTALGSRQPQKDLPFLTGLPLGELLVEPCFSNLVGEVFSPSPNLLRLRPGVVGFSVHTPILPSLPPTRIKGTGCDESSASLSVCRA